MWGRGLEVFAPWGGVVGAELVAEHGGLADGALGVVGVEVVAGGYGFGVKCLHVSAFFDVDCKMKKYEKRRLCLRRFSLLLLAKLLRFCLFFAPRGIRGTT